MLKLPFSTPQSKGFSLLEVVIATTILALVVAGLAMTLSLSLKNVRRAQYMTQAVPFARQKMAELEQKLDTEGFPETFSQEETGTIEGSTLVGSKVFKFSRKVEKVKADFKVAGTMSLESGATSTNVMEALSGLQDSIQQTVRRLTVRVMWDEPGKKGQFVELVMFKVDKQGLNKPKATP